MKSIGILKGFIKTFETNGPGSHMFYDFRKSTRDFLNKFNIPFYDPCCPDADTADLSPVGYSATNGLQFYNAATEAWATASGGVYQDVAQNNITAGTGGAIVVTNYLTTINTDAGGDAFTLANGTQVGQMKKILLVVDGGGDGVVTPATAFAGGGTTATFDDAGDYIILRWNGAAWRVIENSGVTVA